jgi:hypothetical protein
MSGSSGGQINQPFIGRPYAQTYGGAPAPYADDGAQIEDTRRMTQQGAGRFGANSAARYGFGGGSFWRPDAMTPGQPAPRSPFQPQPPMTPPQQPNPTPMTGRPPAPMAPPQQGQMATFQNAIKTDPWLASHPSSATATTR